VPSFCVVVAQFATPNECGLCGKVDAFKQCGKCMAVWYCNKEHQVQAWSQHKKQCYMSLTSLLLRHNHIGDPGALALVSAMCALPTLTVLDVQGNLLRGAGASALARAVADHPALHTLRLSFNDPDENVYVAASFVPLSHLDATADAAQALVDLVQRNSTLTALIWKGPCAAADVIRVVLALRINVGLQRFHVSVGATVLDAAQALPRGDRLALRRVLGHADPPSFADTVVRDTRFLLSVDELTLGRELGRGHFGAVYASDWCGRLVCVKMFLPDRTVMQLQISEFALLNELGTAAVAALAPACVFAERFAVTAANELWIVLPWMNRGALDTLGASVSGAVRVALLGKAAQALAMLHAQSVVHRDVAARNFLMEVTEGGEMRVKVCDFGLACALQRSWEPDERPESIWPPEVVAKDQPFTCAGDVFSFGLLMADLLNHGRVSGRLDHAAVAEWADQPELDVEALVHAMETASAAPEAFASDAVIAAAVPAAPSASVHVSGSGSDPSQPYMPMYRGLQQGDNAPRRSSRYESRRQQEGSHSSPSSSTDSVDIYDSLGSSGASSSAAASAEEKDPSFVQVQWAVRCALQDPSAVSPVLPLLIQWCTRAMPSQRPSMRLVACLLRLAPTRDLSALPEIFMAEDMAAAPDSPADWPLLLWILARRTAASAATSSIAWPGRPVSEAAVEAVTALVSVRGVVGHVSSP
jgi:serine/threonine protein kinase